MKKIKISAAPILKFLRELSVIVTGIIITVGIGFWVNNNNNKNDMKQYLDTVITELEKNADLFDRYALWLNKSVRYSNYIRSNDKNALNKDSLTFYTLSTSIIYDVNSSDYGCGSLNPVSGVSIFTTDAFEMLKSSGAMRQVKDKELLLAICEAYTIVEDTKYNIEMNFQEKKNEWSREVHLLAEGKPVAVPMELFYSYYGVESLKWGCTAASERIRDTLTKLKASNLVKR